MGTYNIDNAEMAFRIRSSKFRHVFGNSTRKDQCYEGLKLSKHSHDSNQAAVNPRFLSVCTESAGGGSFVVLPLEKTGRVDINLPKVCGHSGPVLDVKWNPFNDYVVASSSEDATVKVWEIPEGGLGTNLNDWSVDLHGHQRRVGYIEWHPTAENVLLSAGLDYKCIIWNVEQAEPINVISSHPDTVFSLSWNRDGSSFATTCKDKKIRVIDPRAGCAVMECAGHQGPKSSKVIMLANNLSNYLYSTGFSRGSERQQALWDIRNMGKSLATEVIDYSNGILTPFYDYDTSVVFLVGKEADLLWRPVFDDIKGGLIPPSYRPINKSIHDSNRWLLKHFCTQGDGNIRYYELVPSAPYCHYLNQFPSSTPQRSVCAMPKRGCDAHKNEIMRFYKLYADKGIVEPISMIVPRRAETFQDDIFPPTLSSTPSLTADEWISGLNRNPILISMQDGHVTNTPHTSAAVAVQKQESALMHAPTITTYKAVNKQHHGNGAHYPEAKVPKKSATVPPFEGTTVTVTASLAPSQQKIPASIKNIQRLSSHESMEETSSETSSLDNVNDIISKYERRWKKPPDNIDVTPDYNNYNTRTGWSPRNSLTSNGTSAKDVEPPLTPLSLFNSLMGNETSPTATKFFPEDTVTTTTAITTATPTITTTTSESKSENYSWKTSQIYNRNSQLANQNNNNESVPKSDVTRTNTSKIHVKKVWSPPPATPPQPDWQTNALPNTDPELKKAYFRQVEEIRSLKEQLNLKDKRIRQLEEELTLIRDMQCGPGESNC